MELDRDGEAEEAEFLAILTERDREEYTRLKAYFARNMRARRCGTFEEFTEVLKMVYGFINIRPGGEHVRSFVCGVMFGPGYLLIRQDWLGILLCRAKSGISTIIKKFGFASATPGDGMIRHFLDLLLPRLPPALVQARAWGARMLQEEGKSARFFANFAAVLPGTEFKEIITPEWLRRHFGDSSGSIPSADVSQIAPIQMVTVGIPPEDPRISPAWAEVWLDRDA
jgi:hypothetical protein